jgi:hypothetical protein
MFGLYLLILFLNLKFWLTFPQQSKAENRWAKGAQHLCPIGAPFAQLHAWSKLASLTPSARLL